MKQILLFVSILLTNGISFSQTEQLNQQKYWTFRDAMREDFIKISEEAGGSIVARGILPNDCFDNSVDAPVHSFTRSTMHFGDGMIRHGYYLSLLATEYKLLKDAGQDTRGVLNELYYALDAINRLDLNAEAEQSAVYEFFLPESLNGFYQREDIPLDFGKANWTYSEMKTGCVDSPHAKSNNVLGENGTFNGTEMTKAENSYQNVPSLDQFSALMLGFRLVHKLVDNVYVQPTANDPGHYLVTETQAIVNRMMTYLNEHNWMMIDVNGWPVNNGGGNAIYSAYPLEKAAYIITDNHYDTEWHRQYENIWINKIMYCITGYGVKDNMDYTQQQACNSVWSNPLIGQFDLLELSEGAEFGDDNNMNNSVYQEWLADGNIHGGTNFLHSFWGAFNTIAHINQFIDDAFDDGTAQSMPFPFDGFLLNDPDVKVPGSNDGNLLLLTSNVGVAGNIFTPESINYMTNITGNKQLDLMQAVLEGQTPIRPKEFFEDYFNSMPMSGAYNLKQGKNFSDGSQLTISSSAVNGWAAEDRWTWASDVNGGVETGSFGRFNNMDYMLAYNLYRIVFNVQAQTTYGSEQGEECFCGDNITYTIPNPLPPKPFGGSYNMADFTELKGYLDEKLSYLPTCTENVFDKVNNLVINTFNIEPYFPYYSDISIFTNEFETENAGVVNGGYVNVNTNFIICNNSKLTMQTGSIMKINKRHVSVNSGSTIDLSGDLYVQGGTELRIKAGGNLILRPGSKLILHENCSVIIESGAALTYYNGATIYTKNDDSGKLIIKGSLNLENNAVFAIDHSFSTTSGLIVFEGKPIINAKPGAKIELTAKGKNDLIVQLKQNTKVFFADTDLQHINFTDCGIDVSAANTLIRFEQPVNTLRAKFKGGTALGGHIALTDLNLFRQTDFVDMSVYAQLDIENNAILRMTSCNFTQEYLPYINGTGIDVYGRGYSLSSCNFNIYANGNAMVESEKLTIKSAVSGCNFADIQPGNIGQTAIYDVSNVEILVASSNFNTLRNAIDKSTGKLTLRCNTFTNSRDNSVTMRGGLLNMSIGTGGGYNTFTPMTGTSSTRCHIYLEKALIDMSYGSNYLRDVPVAGGLVRGTLQTTCSSASTCNLDFSGNQWNPVPVITPVSTRFSIKSANNISFSVNTILPMPKAACGSLDVINGFVSVLGSTVNTLLNQIPTYYSQLEGQTLRLDQGIQKGMDRMTALHEGIGNDMEALAYFDEIFRSNISYGLGNPTTQKLLIQAKSQMKTALESAMEQNLVTPGQNLYNFDATTEDFINGTNKLTSSEVTVNNYFRQFYNELDKAQVLRAIGQPQKSLELLTELESCGLDYMEQNLVNREKKYAMKDIRISQLGMAFLDTVYIPDTSTFITPVNYGGAYHFGSFIQNLNVIDYQNCMGSKSLITETENILMVFPNPASEEITIKFSHEAMEGKATVQIFQHDGRLMTSSVLNEKQQQEWKVNVSDWAPGTYQYVYIRPDGVRYSGVFVVI